MRAWEDVYLKKYPSILFLNFYLHADTVKKIDQDFQPLNLTSNLQ